MFKGSYVFASYSEGEDKTKEGYMLDNLDFLNLHDPYWLFIFHEKKPL